MKKLLIAILSGLATLAIAETDYEALPRIEAILDGQETFTSVTTVGDVTAGDDLVVADDAAIGGTLSAIDSSGLEYTVQRPAVTNGQLLVATYSGQVNLIDASGQASGYTNVITLRGFAAADVGRFVYIGVHPTASNLVSIAANSSNWSGPATVIAAGEIVPAYILATNSICPIGN